MEVDTALSIMVIALSILPFAVIGAVCWCVHVASKT